MANELKMIFGTAQTVINYSTDNTNSGNFLNLVPPTEFNNVNDALVPYAPLATATLTFDCAATPTLGATIDLYMVKKNVDGATDDLNPPDGNGANANGAQYVGSFVCEDVATQQRRTITISLEGVLAADFYLKNNSGVALNSLADNATVLKITPFTYKPA